MKKRMNVVLLTPFAAKDVTDWAVKLQQGQEMRNECLELAPSWELTHILLLSLTTLPLIMMPLSGWLLLIPETH